jgi:hypothetical protein
MCVAEKGIYLALLCCYGKGAAGFGSMEMVNFAFLKGIRFLRVP